MEVVVNTSNSIAEYLDGMNLSNLIMKKVNSGVVPGSQQVDLVLVSSVI